MPPFVIKMLSSSNKCCTCNCHSISKPTTTTTTTTTTTSATIPVWLLSRISRRSSSTSSTTTISNTSFTEDTFPIMDDNSTDDKRISDFKDMYSLAIDEMKYATESQGSIYYSGDLIEAKEAVDKCLLRFQDLIQMLPSSKSYKLQQEWTDMLFDLRSRLESLPSSCELP